MSNGDIDSVELLERWRNGDQEAETEMFDRYVNRLCGLARARLSKKMQRRIDPEDIVMSAYRSFFRNAIDQYTIQRSGDLWRLLAAITINKTLGQVDFHSAEKRQLASEESQAADESMLHAVVRSHGSEPTPEQAASLVEELADVLASLSALSRQIAELSLQNQTCDQIAKTVRRSDRTVRRELGKFRDELQKRLLP